MFLQSIKLYSDEYSCSLFWQSSCGITSEFAEPPHLQYEAFALGWWEAAHEVACETGSSIKTVMANKSFVGQEVILHFMKEEVFVQARGQHKWMEDSSKQVCGSTLQLNNYY